MILEYEYILLEVAKYITSHVNSHMNIFELAAVVKNNWSPVYFTVSELCSHG